MNYMKKTSVLFMAAFVVVTAQAQTVIDPLTGSLSGYTDTTILDNSHGGGLGVSFTDSASGLQANYVGTGNNVAEQALFLAPASSFSSSFSVGKTLSVNVVMPGTGPVTDFGLAIAAATPVAASGPGWDSRATFDWASISLRPSQNAIRVNSSISGTLTTANGAVGIGTGGTANVSQLYITWTSANVFTLGYVISGVQTPDITLTFAPSSTIGTDIGFYGDLRNTSTSLGNFSALTVSPVPEPSTLALCGMGVGSLLLALRRKK